MGAKPAAPSTRSLVVPAGGLAPDHARWIRAPKSFFLPARVLTKIFRGKFVDGLKRLYRAYKVGFHGALRRLADSKQFRKFLRQLFRKDWVVYAKRPFRGPEYVLQYLARYTHRVAISNHRLIAYQDGKVSFRYRITPPATRSRRSPLVRMSSSAGSFCTSFREASFESATSGSWRTVAALGWSPCAVNCSRMSPSQTRQLALRPRHGNGRARTEGGDDRYREADTLRRPCLRHSPEWHPGHLIGAPDRRNVVRFGANRIGVLRQHLDNRKRCRPLRSPPESRLRPNSTGKSKAVRHIKPKRDPHPKVPKTEANPIAAASPAQRERASSNGPIENGYRTGVEPHDVVRLRERHRANGAAIDSRRNRPREESAVKSRAAAVRGLPAHVRLQVAAVPVLLLGEASIGPSYGRPYS
jgi:hypothetical protein